MGSKYDQYWVKKLDEIERGIRRANISGRNIIDVSDLADYGHRKNWYGIITICRDYVRETNIMAHMKSLARIITTYGLLKEFSDCFLFRVTSDLKLVIEKHVQGSTLFHRSTGQMPGEMDSSNEFIMDSVLGGYRDHPLGRKCGCDPIFKGFLWRELIDIDPLRLPNRPGVYVIRIIEPGRRVDELVHEITDLVKKTRWKELIHYVNTRLRRLYRIRECPVIYIGSSSNIRSRYTELAGIRHTAFFAIFTLLYGGWRLDYGYKTTSEDEAERLEKELKNKYHGMHGALPALVER